MKLALALVAVGSAGAHAEIVGQVAVGASGDGSIGTATLSAEIGVERVRPAPPIGARGLVQSCDPGATDCWNWLVTGLDPDEIDDVGVTAHAALLADRTLMFGGRVWLHRSGWELEFRPEYQPIGDIGDRLARSGRHLRDLDFKLIIPEVLSGGTSREQLSIATLSFDVATLAARHGDVWRTEGVDLIAGMEMVRWRTRTYTLDIVDARFGMLGTADGGVLTSDLDIVRTTWHVESNIQAVARVGIASTVPNSAEPTNGAPAPESVEPAYGLELRGTIDPHQSWSLAAGSWMRFDPTGFGVDVGNLAAGTLAWQLGRIHTDVRGELGRVRRDVVGIGAPADVAPVGTKAWLGRGEVGAAIRVKRRLELRGDVWVEHSDRDDPRWLVPASGELATHRGLDVSAAWLLGRS